MTENFMKLSDFLKLIKKEDEPDTPETAEDAGTGESDVSDGAAGSVGVQPAGGDGAGHGKSEDKKISAAELAIILGQYSWKPQSDSSGAKAKEREKRAEQSHRQQIREHPGDIKDLFKAMDTGVIKELFTPEELNELTRDEQTHIFTSEDMKNITGGSRGESHAVQTDEDMTRHVPRVDTKAGAKAPKKQPDAVRTETKREDDWGGRTIRRSRRHRTGCLGGLLYFGFVMCVSVALASLGWIAANDVLSLNKPLVSAQITVPQPAEGEKPDIDAIATDLRDSGIIEYKRLFKLFARFADAKDKIDPGTYELNSGLDYRALVAGMQQYVGWSSEERETVTVMIPEGKTMKETFGILEQAGVCASDKLMDAATQLEFDYDFLASNTLNSERRLEGYLFPDTYEFYVNSEPEQVINKMLVNFGARVTDEMFRQAEALGYSMHDIVTVASLIEMEAGNDEERSTIASVIYNRLDSNYYPYLQIDASVIYALGERREEITYSDRMIDSPYNTFVYEGLPPGAIANPGIASIRAALMPAETGYYFYALGQNGSHEFFSSYSQFENFINSSDFGG